MLVAKLFTILYQEFNTYWTEKKLNPYRWLSLHRWETDNNYCKNKVLNKPPYNFGPRLLDLLDTALFDFLIGRYLLADSIHLVLSWGKWWAFGAAHAHQKSYNKIRARSFCLFTHCYVSVNAFTEF